MFTDEPEVPLLTINSWYVSSLIKDDYVALHCSWLIFLIEIAINTHIPNANKSWCRKSAQNIVFVCKVSHDNDCWFEVKFSITKKFLSTVPQIFLLLYTLFLLNNELIVTKHALIHNFSSYSIVLIVFFSIMQ